MAKARQTYGAIHGVIHAAGVISDAPLMRKRPAEMWQVSAQSYRRDQLDAATRDDPLDCFLLFSSLVAFFGNAGQADYAYANSFLHGFADWREAQR